MSMATVKSDLNWSAESKEIHKEAGKLFSQSTLQEVVIPSLKSNYNQICNLLTALEMAKAKKNRTNLTKNMKSAYLLIMQMRTLLLGDPNNKISYRFYVSPVSEFNEENAPTEVVDISEDNIMNYVERSQDNLRIKKNIYSLLNGMDRVSQAEQLLAQHKTQITKSLVKLPNTNGYVVPKDNLLDLESSIQIIQSKANLYWQDKKGKRGKTAYTPKIFNQGWIMQALDQTFEDLYWSQQDPENIVPEDKFRRQFFFSNLVYDKVSGFKGGDVANRQIKSNKADLVSLTHLIKYLTILKEILGGMVLDKTLLAQKIAEAFSSTNDLTDPINRNIEAVAEELINSFNLNKN